MPRIYYQKRLIDPRNGPYKDKLYRELYYTENDTPITMTKSFFYNHYKHVATEEYYKKSAQQLEYYFQKYNQPCTNPLGTEKGQNHLKELGVRHTSMSIGDVIMVNVNEYYIAYIVGFRRLILR